MLEVNRTARTIYGRAIPYGVAALNNRWRVQYEPGSLHWQEPLQISLLIRHDKSLIVGKAISLIDTQTELWAKFRVSLGPKGDRALSLAETIYGGLSVGVDDMTTVTRGDVWVCERAKLVEISLTPNPVFS